MSSGSVLAGCGARPALLNPSQAVARLTRSFIHRAVGLLDRRRGGRTAGSPREAVSLGVPLGPENSRALSRQSFPPSIHIRCDLKYV